MKSQPKITFECYTPQSEEFEESWCPSGFLSMISLHLGIRFNIVGTVLSTVEIIASSLRV
jgi:hypothetical protein